MVMAKERLVEQYGELRYTIGTGCSGGSLTQQQVANAYPGLYQGILPACSFPDAWSTGQQLAAYNLLRALPRGPDQVGARRRLGAGLDRRGRGPSQPRQLDRLRHGLLDRRSACRTTAARASRPSRTTTPRRTPTGVRCTLADYMINVLRPAARGAVDAAGAGGRLRLRRPAARRRGRAVRPEGAREGPDHAGAVRRPEREGRRRRHRHQPDPRAPPGHAARARPRLQERRDQPGQQPRPGRDHRPARARPGRVPRRVPLVGDPRAARARAGPLQEPRDLVRPRAADGRPELRERRRSSRWTAGWRPSRPTRATSRSRRRSSPTGPTDIQDKCSQVAGVEQVVVPGHRHGLRERAGPDALRHAGARSRARASPPTRTSAS